MVVIRGGKLKRELALHRLQEASRDRHPVKPDPRIKLWFKYRGTDKYSRMLEYKTKIEAKISRPNAIYSNTSPFGIAKELHQGK